MMNFKGVGVALVTPFKHDKSVDTEALKKLVTFVVDGGVDYLVVMGTTAENPVLNEEEKQSVIETALEANHKRVPVVLGIGGYDTAKVIKEIKKAEIYKGTDAILSVTPYYNKPNQTGLYEHFSAIAQSTDLPIILYNVPGRTGINMLAETTLKLAHQYKNIKAIKEASGSLDQIMYIVEHKPSHFQVVSGDDGITLPLISVGVEGVISVVANAIPALFSQMVHHALSNKIEEARKMHYTLLEFCRLAFAEGNPTGIKNALWHLGIIQNELRLPLVPASAPLSQKIKNWIQYANK